MKKKVLLGMSGGVDSSVSAILLIDAGYEVIGATMNFLDDHVNTVAARNICEKLGIKHFEINLENTFKCKVINKFISEYENARTPNPCIECNKYLKFGFFYEEAKKLGCEYIATGHYAKTEFSNKYNRYVLKVCEEEKKDQTYFLYTVSPDIIEHIIFPLQNLNSKKATRDIAAQYGLEVAEKKDSQEICFIKDNDYKSFLKVYVKQKPGNFVLTTGEVIGKHTGITNYTIGQRKGLEISFTEPLYVIRLNKNENEIILGTEKELYSSRLYAQELNWLVYDKLPLEIECYAKIRYRSKLAKVKVVQEGEDKVLVSFLEPQRAITSGQAIVFYDSNGVVLGGGKIL